MLLVLAAFGLVGGDSLGCRLLKRGNDTLGTLATISGRAVGVHWTAACVAPPVVVISYLLVALRSTTVQTIPAAPIRVLSLAALDAGLVIWATAAVEMATKEIVVFLDLLVLARMKLAFHTLAKVERRFRSDLLQSLCDFALPMLGVADDSLHKNRLLLLEFLVVGLLMCKLLREFGAGVIDVDCSRWRGGGSRWRRGGSR